MILKLHAPKLHGARLHEQRAGALYDEQAQRLHQERLLIRGAKQGATELSAAAFFGAPGEGDRE